MRYHTVWITIGLLAATLMLVRVPETLSKEKTGSGQTVYVPAYATIFHGDREHQYKLTITLSIRNTDIERPITLMAVDYYDSSGKRLKRYLPGKRLVSPLKALHYVVDESDVSGGPGACFIVQWYSAAPVSPPVVEAVMIGTSGQQGISFISRGVVIGEN